MKSSLRAVALCLGIVLLTLSSCQQSDNSIQSVPTGDIYGKVVLVDEYNNPLTNLQGVVSLRLVGKNSYTTTTDKDGNFRFSGVEQGIYRIECKAPLVNDYTTDQFQFVANGDWDFGIVNLRRNWTLQSLGIHVELVDIQGQPSADSADVVVEIYKGSTLLQSKTGRQHFRIDSLAIGNYSIIARKGAWEYDSIGVRIQEYEKQEASLRVFQIPTLQLQLQSVRFNTIGRNQANNADSIEVIINGSYANTNISNLVVSDVSYLFTPEGLLPGLVLRRESSSGVITASMENNSISYRYSVVVVDSSYYALNGHANEYQKQFFIPGRQYKAKLLYKLAGEYYMRNNRLNFYNETLQGKKASSNSITVIM